MTVTWLHNGKVGHAVTGEVTSQSEVYFTVIAKSYESKSERKLIGKSFLIKKTAAIVHDSK